MDKAARLKEWAKWVYEGQARERRLAVRMLREEPELFAGDAWLACAWGDVDAVRAAVAADAAWVKMSGGPREMLPLLAVTQSKLMLEAGFEEGLLACAQTLIAAGADVNATWTNPVYPQWPLSALYGAAGLTHSAAMTKLLLDAGANTEDGESLYHSVEGADSTCTRLLLAAGARETLPNAMARALDYGKLDDLKLMLEYNGGASGWSLLHHAIQRGRSMEFIRVLLDAGADLHEVHKNGIGLYRWAKVYGREDVLELLRGAGIEEALTEEQEFVAACTRGDAAAAKAMLAKTPEMLSRLNEAQLRVLPAMADVSNLKAVRLMLELGWPVDVIGGWGGSALNMAVYRGDAPMAELLMQHGADWRTKHAFNNDVRGTLSHASQAEAEDPAAPMDYVGCARVLVEQGVPLSAFEEYTFSTEVAEYFAFARLTQG